MNKTVTYKEAIRAYRAAERSGVSQRLLRINAMLALVYTLEACENDPHFNSPQDNESFKKHDRSEKP